MREHKDTFIIQKQIKSLHHMRIITATGGFRARNERGFPLCQHQDPTKEDHRVKEWWRCEVKHRISHHPLRPAGAQPLVQTQSVFVVLVILSVWMSVLRRVDSTRRCRSQEMCFLYSLRSHVRPHTTPSSKSGIESIGFTSTFPFRHQLTLLILTQQRNTHFRNLNDI